MPSADRRLETHVLDYVAAHTIMVDVKPNYTVSHLIFNSLESVTQAGGPQAFRGPQVGDTCFRLRYCPYHHGRF
jgi:hypothetical protein